MSSRRSVTTADRYRSDWGWGIPELIRFQDHFRDYKIVVYQGLGCDDIMYEGQVDSSKHLNLLYDDVERHYDVITNLKAQWLKVCM